MTTKIKKIHRLVQFYAKAGEVSSQPPIGPMLGQFPIDVKTFCTTFNNDTKGYDKGVLLKVELVLYLDSTFEYKIKSIPLSFLLELSSKFIQIQTSVKIHKSILLYDIYLITLIKNIDYKFLNIKYLFKQILKEIKDKNYLVLEKKDNKNYYIYV